MTLYVSLPVWWVVVVRVAVVSAWGPRHAAPTPTHET
jgi:hypothetical protein